MLERIIAMQARQRLGFMKNLVLQGVGIVLPHRCLMSGVIVDVAGGLSPESWQSLSFISRPFCACCGMPFSFSGEERARGDDAQCAVCLGNPPPYDSARAVLAYDDASRGMILKFKHGDQLHAVQTFAPWLQRAGAEFLSGADWIVPVPLHRWRLLARRYNQSALLAGALSRLCGVGVLPDALLRQRATPTQGHLGFAARAKNVRGAFAVNPRYAEKLAGKKIVLIDDVYTSGATVKECAKALKRAGVFAVHILTVARVVMAE